VIRSVLRALCATTILALCPPPAAAEVVDRIAARVNDDIVTLSDLVRLMPVYLQVVGVDPSRLRSPEGRNDVAREFLDYLVDTNLLLADAETRELTVTDAEVEEYVEAQRARLGISLQAFAAELERQGILLDDFREFLRGNLTRARLMQLDVSSQITISAEDIDRELALVFPDGLYETRITTSHVLVPLLQNATDADVEAAFARIGELRAQIDAGRPFAEVAAEVNPDASRNTGGRIGTFDIQDLDRDYVRAALGVEAGEMTDPVRTAFGVHIILVHAIDRVPVPDAEEMRARVEYELTLREGERQMGAYLSRLRDDAFVEIRMTEFEL
jgi:parvulin-like peptidyl-prolyl isomerase